MVLTILTEYLKMEETYKDHQLQVPASLQDYLKPSHMTKSITQMLLDL